ncbi:MAG: leucine-rich repeat domain-containing protein [Paludibacteraceae bacterium]|nr:leucine-rich repeat domain-containing protein [Paludibacteraceae bacterium]
MKKLITFFLALVASIGTFANSFTGFAAGMNNKMGNQIYTQGLIQNTNNITLIETDATKHQYNINLTNGGTGTFQMGGVTFSYTNSEAGKTAYKTYDYYIQPNGVDREITIPTVNGEQVKIVLMEACAGILVNGVSRDFVEGDNILTATGNSIVLKNSNAKPKINAILSLGGGSTPTPDPDPTSGFSGVQVGNLYYSDYDGNGIAVEVVGHTQDLSGDVVIPSSVTYDGRVYRVTSIGEGAFSYCSGLTSVTIPNSVISIGKEAFRDCRALNTVEIPNSVTSIGEGAFMLCLGMTGELIIPNSVTSIGQDAFNCCNGLSSITISNSITNIESGVFGYCHGLSSITIPNSVTSIGYGAFQGCSGLTSVTIPNSVTSIGNRAFEFCENLQKVNITDIEAWCNIFFDSSSCNPLATAHHLYMNNTEVTELVIPNSVTSIGNYAFSGCTGLTSVTIPNSVTNIGEGAFSGCTGLTSMTIPNSVTSIGNNAFNYVFHIIYNGTATGSPWGARHINKYVEGWLIYEDSTKNTILKCINTILEYIDIPNSVIRIGEEAFYGCKGLTSVTIPNSVTSIGYCAFYECNNLKTVIIGSSVKVLETAAFAYCSSIESITCYSQRPPTVNQDALYGLDYSTIVYVPADYLETYKMHDAWGLYDVRPLGAKSTETTNLSVTPAETTADVAWPQVSGATTYELVIKDKSGNVICTLVFNSNGQLTQIAFNAPARNNAPQQTQAAGFSFTVTGLESGTSYDLTITSKDNNGGTLDTKTVSFTTTGEPQGIEEVSSSLQGGDRGRLILHDGQIYILRGEKIYTVTGQEVK